MNWRVAAGLIVLVAGLAVSAALAQAPGRIYGAVADENGEPLPGVEIRVTDPEVTSFSLSAKTGKKGDYSIVIKDITRAYRFLFEKDGYQTIEATIKLPFRESLEKNLTMLSLEAARAQAVAQLSEAGVQAAPEGPAPAVGSAVLLFNEGAAAAKAGDLDAAEAKLEEAVGLDAELAPAHAALAGIYLKRGRAAEAATAAERAVELDPGNARALEVRYEAYRALGDEEKTGAALAALQALDPARAEADLYERGLALYNAGEIAAAQRVFQQLVAGSPGHAAGHFLLGMCLVNAGDSGNARAHLEKFLALAPDHPDAATAREMLAYLQ